MKSEAALKSTLRAASRPSSLVPDNLITGEVERSNVESDKLQVVSQLQSTKVQKPKASPDSASLQLKSVLGLTTLPSKKASWGNDETDIDKTSFLSIQAEQLVQDNQSISSKSHTNTSVTPAGWQVSGNNGQKSPTLSLREIMSQEQSSHNKVYSGATVAVREHSWAAKASNSASGSFIMSSVNNQARGFVGASAINPSATGTRGGILSNLSVITSGTADTSVDDDFSDSGMSREFATWCTQQLVKISGSKDLTLVKFCLSVESTAEVREYLAANLGSTPQVSHFATDFIKKMEDISNIDPRSKSDPDKKVMRKKKGSK